MRKKAVILTAVMLLSITLVSAQSNQTELNRGPGIVGAGSPLYGLEVAMDNAALGLGMANPGGIAKERAAEAAQAAEKSNSKAAAKAGRQLAKVSEKARGNESRQEIETAMASFQGTMSRMEQRIQNAPNDNARQGMQKALENMRGAYQNMEEARQNREEAGQRGNQTRQERNQTGEQDQRPSNASEAGNPENRTGADDSEETAMDGNTSDNSTGQNQTGRR